jgi:hypothetical protein
MQSAAQGYLIYELTGSAAYLGYVSFAAGLPSWIFTLYAGAIADRITFIWRLTLPTWCSLAYHPASC